MNYKNQYEKLINTRRNSKIDKRWNYEKHHIVPICLGGDDNEDNLILLTIKEHYIAHRLLSKMYPEDTRLLGASNLVKGRLAKWNWGVDEYPVDLGWLEEELKTKSLSQISKESNIGEGILRRRMIRNSIPNPNHQKRAKSPFISSSWLEEELRVKSVIEISIEMKVNKDIIYKIIKDNNIPNPNKYKNSDEVDLEWLEEELKTKSITQISRESRFSWDKIKKRIVDNSIPNPNNKRGRKCKKS